MLKFMLNLSKPNNYAFFCPVSKMHLTASNPVGYADEVTPAILTGLRVKSLIDLENAVNTEAGSTNEDKPKTKKEAAPIKEEKVVAPKEEYTASPVEPTEFKEAEVVAEAPKTAPKKGRKAAKETE